MKLLPAAFTLPEPIRPRRCPAYHQPPTDEGKWDDCTCGGVGFLYPDPPDDWCAKRYGQRTGTETQLMALYGDRLLAWRDFCDTVYLAFGIVDTE